VISQNKPKISVITVVKDDEKGLAITANSVLSQEFKDFEWVIVDSSTNKNSILRGHNLEDLSFVRVLHQIPKGIYPAMNFAVENSSGQWLWFINAGDVFLSKQSMSYMASQISTNEQLGIIACAVVQVTDLGYFYSYCVPRLDSFLNYVVANFHHQGTLINTRWFLESGGYDESLRFASDGKILDSIAQKSTVAFSEKALVGFKLGGLSGLNLRQTLAEIASYRPPNESEKTKSFLIVKNFLRIRLLRIEKFMITKLYLELREKKNLRVFGLSNFLSEESISDKKRNRGFFFHLVDVSKEIDDPKR